MPNNCILLYDDTCPLCVRFKQALEKIPGSKNIDMVSVHDENIYQSFQQLNKYECLKDIHFLDEKANIYKGKEALTQIIKRFPHAENFSWLIESGMGQKVVGYFNKVAKNYRDQLIKECKDCNS